MYETVSHSPILHGYYVVVFTVFLLRNHGFFGEILRDFLTILML
jgi:hypothetical protein